VNRFQELEDLWPGFESSTAPGLDGSIAEGSRKRPVDGPVTSGVGIQATWLSRHRGAAGFFSSKTAAQNR